MKMMGIDWKEEALFGDISVWTECPRCGEREVRPYWSDVCDRCGNKSRMRMLSGKMPKECLLVWAERVEA